MIEVRRVSDTQLDGVSLYLVFCNGMVSVKKVYARSEKEAIESVEERKAYLAELGKRGV